MEDTTEKRAANLLMQLHHLLDLHRKELGEPHMNHELEWLAEWAESTLSRGFPAPALGEQTTQRLQGIISSLQQTIADEQQLSSETPQNTQMTAQYQASLHETRKQVSALLRHFNAAS